MDNILLWVTAVGAIATAIATIGLVVVAHKTLGGAKDQLTLLRNEAEQERRPYVVADIVPGLHGPGSTDLVLQNLGRSIARGVLVDIGPLSKRNDTDHISDPLARYLTNPRTLVPSARHRVMWHDVGNPKPDEPPPASPTSSRRASPTPTTTAPSTRKRTRWGSRI